MNKYLLVIFSFNLILIGILPHSANADRIRTCTNFYKDVDILFLNVEGNVPNILPTTWKDTAELIKNQNLKFAQDAGLDIQTTYLPAEDIFKKYPKAIYVRVVYSYAPKTSFSTALDSDVLSVWTEMQRYPKFNNELPIVKSRQKLMFFDPINESRPIFYSPAYNGLLESIACNILSYTRGKSCTNLSDFSKNELIDKPNSCVSSSN
ncbi:MAG: hypothetical protein PHX61_02745 [Alphaproteobacteria bacterium]|nr:hypothetical protein [Alphaproteobacteria bacterium]